MGFEAVELRDHERPPRPRRWAPHTTTVHDIPVRATKTDAEGLRTILERLDVRVLRAVGAEGVRIVVMEPWETYGMQSTAMRPYGAVADRLPVAPAGVFSRADRAIYLRECTAAAAIHELGHAVDFTLGGGAYHSTNDPAIAAAYATPGFVTAYSAQDHAEYFAEGIRAWYDGDAPGTTWQHVSRDRLRAIDPAMYRIIANAIDTLAGSAQPE